MPKPQSPRSSPTASIWPGALAIIFLTMVVYSPALKGEFLFDDVLSILQNPLIVLPGGLPKIWFSTEPLDYFPLTLTSFWIEWRLWGTNTLNFHLLNVFLHAASAVVLWRILLRLRIQGAWVAAVVFAVHPLCVSSVAWITERKNTLSMIFFLLAILLFLQCETAKNRSRKQLYVFSLIAFLLALLSKTSVVMLPVVLIGLAWWQRGQISRSDILRTAPFFALSLVMGLVTIWFQHHRASGGETGNPLVWTERIAGAGWASWFYLLKSLLPVNLAMFYPEWEINGMLAFVPGILLLLTLFALWWFRKTEARHVLVGLAYFLVMLFPVLGFFDMFFFYYSRVADHFAYLAVIGLIVLIVGGATAWVQRFANGKFGGQARLVAAALIIAFSFMSWKEAAAFKNEEALWRATLKSNPKAWAALNNLAIVLEDKGRFDEAEQLYREAIALKPDFERAHFNLGVLFEKQGKLTQSETAYRETLRIRPVSYDAMHNLANVLSRQGKNQEAIKAYEASIELHPRFDQAYYNLSLVLENTGRRADAIARLRKALEITPDFQAANEFLQELLTKNDRPAQQ
jgi:tetratricopeptide (TPR) repeat protein